LASGEQKPTAGSATSAVGYRPKSGSSSRLVISLVVLLIVLSIGLIAILQRPRSRWDSDSPVSQAERASEPLLVPAPLESLDELSDDIALPQDPAEVAWTDASAEPIRRGDVSVRIVSAQLGRPKLMRATGAPARPADDVLIVKVRLENKSESWKVEYAGWAARKPGSDATLTDNFNNPYPQKSWRGATIEGQLARESLDPGESVEDLLVFQRPQEKADLLRLRLPASAFGETGTLNFAVPMSMVTGQEGSSERSSGPAAVAAEGSAEPLPPGRGVPAIERGIAEAEKQGNKEAGILEKVNEDTEAIGGGDELMAEGNEEHDFEEILRDRKDLEPARRKREAPQDNASGQEAK
jgi:hypothetical protein